MGMVLGFSNKIKIPMADGTVKEGVEIPITQSLEKWGEIELADDTKIRIKYTSIRVIRFDNERDPDGNPVYVVQGHPELVIVNSGKYEPVPETEQN